MFDQAAFLNDPLIKELKENEIVKRPEGNVTPLVAIALVNHSRNNNVRIQVKPKSTRPELFDYVNKNPTEHFDQARGEFSVCLTHANSFVISCAGAPANVIFETSLGQMIADLGRNNPNIEIYVNGNLHTSSEFLSVSGNIVSFNPGFLAQYDVTYVDNLGDYQLKIDNGKTARIELRVLAPGNGMTPNQVSTLFSRSTIDINETLEYHSNNDFYGFTVCLTVLPKQEISCAGSTPSTYIELNENDRYDVTIGNETFTNITLEDMVARFELAGVEVVPMVPGAK